MKFNHYSIIQLAVVLIVTTLTLPLGWFWAIVITIAAITLSGLALRHFFPDKSQK